MSNAKKVIIEGRMPFDCNENKEVASWLASMNTPMFGLRITWGTQPHWVPNNMGGRTGFFDFTILGIEAVSYDAFEELKKAILTIGGTLSRWDIVDTEG